MGKITACSLTIVLFVLCACAAEAGITRHDVLVIANSNSPKSLAVASYYQSKRGIPASHMRTVNCSTSDVVSPADFVVLRDQIKAHLISLGSVAGSPATDPISTIVLCTGVPFKVSDSGECYSSVDSALSACFTDSTWGKEPLGIYGDYQPAPGFSNPYYGEYGSALCFDSFRANASASTTWEAFPAPGFTLVRMLDADTALAAGGGGVLFRGTRSGGVWTWSPVQGKDRAFIGWKVTCISVLDSTHAYACTGNPSKPHGGGTVIATSDGGLTWSRLRYSGRGSAWKLRDALLGVDFGDTSHGWAIGTSQAAGGAVTPLMLVTSDGGTSWQNLSANLPSYPSFTPRAVSAADANNVWICGASGGIYHSTDGGNTWSPANSGAPLTVDYTCIWIRSSEGPFKGWAAGESGKIIRTENGSTWAVEAPGMTSSNITDFSAYSQDCACAAYGGTSFLSFTEGNWSTEPTGLASTVSAASPGGNSGVAVGGTRYIFADSGSGWPSVCSVADTPWRLRYLVTRLDGYAADANVDGIPDDIKAIIDRAYATASSGQFVLDEANSGENVFKPAHDALDPIVGSSRVTWDTTSTFLTHQSNVMGYTSWGMHDSSTDSYTTFGRPFNTWANGGIGVVLESTDGRAFSLPNYVWGMSTGGTVYPGKLAIDGFQSAPTYSGFTAKLHSSSGTVLASGTLVAGKVQIDLSTVNWADHNTYVQLYFPTGDPLHPGGPIDHAHYPWSGSNTDVYNNRTAGFSLVTSNARSLLSEMLREGASGGFANVDEPWSSYVADPTYLYPNYAKGYTFAESAYMSLPGLGWQEVAVGDPLMAPYATPPTVTITAPSADGQIKTGTVRFSATVTPSSIAKVEFWLDDDTLLLTDVSSPYYVDLDTTTLLDGLHRVEAIAFENDLVQNVGSATRAIISNNYGAIRARINDLAPLADGTTVGLQGAIVSAAFNGTFYIEELNRSRGIRVRSATQVAEGNTVTVIGHLQKTDNEREIHADGVYVTAP